MTRFFLIHHISQQVHGVHHGIRFKCVDIGERKCKLQIWDTAGQERFRSLARVFYNNAAVCIMVYDITKKYTFEELNNFWSEDVHNNISGTACKLKL